MKLQLIRDDRKMSQGSYISKITVKGDDAEASTKFLIRNSRPEVLDLFIFKMKIWSVSSIPAVAFFSYYRNVEKVDTQFLITFDQNGIILTNGKLLRGRPIIITIIVKYQTFQHRIC
jgi:hypothetical protein